MNRFFICFKMQVEGLVLFTGLNFTKHLLTNGSFI